MCGRFGFVTLESLADRFDLDRVPSTKARYNIAPGQKALVVRTGPDGQRYVRELLWGLVPFWAKEVSIGYKLINARAETAAGKPAFRQAYKSRRCLIPADGFYEWAGDKGRKKPFFIRLKGGNVFGMAGLWEHWDGGDGPLESFTILTTRANEIIRPLHDRMPVILGPERYQAWLNPDGPPDPVGEAAAFFEPFDPGLMEMWAVSPWVNKVGHEGPECIQPAPKERDRLF